MCYEEFTEEIPAQGHKFGEWEVTKKATDKAEGKKERVCSVCGEKESEVIPVISAQPDEPKQPGTPNIPNTTGMAITYIVASVIGIMALSATAGTVIVKRKRSK